MHPSGTRALSQARTYFPVKQLRSAGASCVGTGFLHTCSHALKRVCSARRSNGVAPEGPTGVCEGGSPVREAPLRPG